MIYERRLEDFEGCAVVVALGKSVKFVGMKHNVDFKLTLATPTCTVSFYLLLLFLPIGA